MAELNFNALAPTGPRGFYQGFEQGQKEKVASEINQIKLDELKRDRDEMMQLRDRLKSLGQDPDPIKFLDALAQTGNPDHVKMAIEGKQKIKDLESYAKLGVIEPVTATPAMPTGAPAPASSNALGSVGMDQPAANAMMPAPSAAPAAPANALAAQPGADQAARAQQRLNQLLMFARTNPRMAGQVMAEAKILQDQLQLLQQTNKPYVVGGRLVTGTGQELYTAPDKPTDLQRNYEFAKTPAGGNFKGSLAEFKVLDTPRTTVNVPVNVSTEKKYGERFGGLIADADAAKLAAAENAPNAAATADRVMDLIGTGKVITGTGANVRLQIAKALNLAGGTDSDKIRNTEVLISSLAETTLGAIKSSNLGAGQGFTNADRDFLEKAKAGQLTYDSKSLTELARLSRLAAEKSAESWNKRVTQIPASALEGTGISTEPVVVPKRSIMKNSGQKGAASTGAPAGVDPNIWQYMTPEERNLWLK